MRFLILFGIPILLGLTLIAFGIWAWAKAHAPGTGTSTNNLKALGTGADAVRLLDQILVDPTLIGSLDWRHNARDIVTEWYGRGHKQIGS